MIGWLVMIASFLNTKKMKDKKLQTGSLLNNLFRIRYFKYKENYKKLSFRTDKACL